MFSHAEIIVTQCNMQCFVVHVRLCLANFKTWKETIFVSM